MRTGDSPRQNRGRAVWAGPLAAIVLALLATLSPGSAAAAACSPTVTTPTASTDVLVRFTATGTCTWTPPAGLARVHVLVVGGGGGGGVNIGGGGGGGGVREETAFEITEGQAVTVTVGGGGSGGYYSNYNGSQQCPAQRDGTSGGASAFGSLAVLGGGHGLGRQLAGNGGSGGGSGPAANCNATQPPLPACAASGNWGPVGLGTAGQGYDGSCGGGGGAGGPGEGKNGGPGRESSITGVATRYAGGGGLGTCCGSANWGTGGAGGGGSGGGYHEPGNGTAGTGGGGGGGGHWAGWDTGGNGGSGIVLVRYPTPTIDPPDGATLTFTRGQTGMVATWNAPGGTGVPVLEYETELEGPGNLCSTTSGPRRCTFLVPEYGTAYRSRTRARSSLGWTAWSAWSAPVTPLDVPLQPGRTKAAVPGDERLTFAWHPWLERGRPVTRYEVTVEPGGRSCAWQVGDGELTCTVTGLTNGREYEGTITATNEIGTGQATFAGSGIPFGRPRPPQAPSVRVYGDDLAVDGVGTWGNNGRKVDRREFQLDPGDRTCLLASYWCVIRDVEFGRAYRARVREETEGGWSEWSEWGAPVLAERVPVKPRFIDFLPGDARLHLAWEEPTFMGRPVIEYEACVYPVQASRGPDYMWIGLCERGYGAKICKVTAASKTLGCTFTGLWNGYNYRAAVRARNGLGWGEIQWSGAGSGAPELIAPVAVSRDRWQMTTTGRAKVRTACLSRVPCETRARLTFPVAPYVVLGEWVRIEPGATVDLQIELPAEIRTRLAAGDDFVVKVAMETRAGAIEWPKVLPLSAPPADAVGPVTRVNRTPTREFTAVADCDGEGISRCTGTVTLEPVGGGGAAGRAAGDPEGLGRARFSAAAGERIEIRVRLDAAGRALLAKRGAVAVRPVIRMEGGIPAPALPIVRFMEITDVGLRARVEQVAATQDRDAFLATVRAASQQRLHWRDAILRLRTEVLPAQGAALRIAVGLPDGTPAQRRVRSLLVSAAERQIRATRGYIRWFAHDDPEIQQRAIGHDRAAQADLRRALRIVRGS